MHGVKFTYPADKRLKRLANVHFHGNLNIEVQDLHDFLALEWSFRLRTLWLGNFLLRLAAISTRFCAG